MYYENDCVFNIPLPEARGYKTHNSFHNTSYGMKIHLRSYIYLAELSVHQSLGPFGSQDKRCTLPGRIGLPKELSKADVPIALVKEVRRREAREANINMILEQASEHKHKQTIMQVKILAFYALSLKCPL